MKRYTYDDRRKQGHSPFWAFLISTSQHPVFNVIFVAGLGVVAALVFISLIS